MKVFICPDCGRMTVGSRKKEVLCSKCNETVMISTKIAFEKYAQMDEQQRRDYAQSWLFIHNAAKRR